jgi:hypothetical protein
MPHLLRLYSWRQREQDARYEAQDRDEAQDADHPYGQKQSTVLLPYRVHKRGPAAIRLAAATSLARLPICSPNSAVALPQ